MSPTVVLFLKSEYKTEIAKCGSDEYQAFIKLFLQLFIDGYEYYYYD